MEHFIAAFVEGDAAQAPDGRISVFEACQQAAAAKPGALSEFGLHEHQARSARRRRQRSRLELDPVCTRQYLRYIGEADYLQDRQLDAPPELIEV